MKESTKVCTINSRHTEPHDLSLDRTINCYVLIYLELRITFSMFDIFFVEREYI